jgi:phosphoglycerate dehydrogenase-like enzyme
VLGYDRLDKTLRRTDYFMLACPLTDVNEELIDLAELTTLLSSAAVNVARRSVVIDTLVAGLQTEYIRGAGLDVTNSNPIL